MFDQGHGDGGDGFACAHRTDSVIALRFEADLGAVQTHRLSQVGDHLCTVGPDPGDFEDHGDVDVVHREAALLENRPEPAEELEARSSTPLLIVAGKVLADVAKPCRPEQGIGHGVANGVAVGVSLEAEVPRQRDAGEDQGTAHHQAMNVVAQSDSWDRQPPLPASLRDHVLSRPRQPR
jgi:hypothetical protein